MTATDVRTAPSPRLAGGVSSQVPKPRTPVARSERRRGDVEGLRAIAVLAVVAFHGALPWATGGFVGVDIFFVISGFLITGLMLRDVERHGRVRLADFYARRARRILPLAGVVVVLTLLATALIRPPLATLGVAKDAVATILYASNWWFLDQQTDYLGSTSAPSPLLHFWSLSVEEQFYLGWPLVILAVALVFRRRPRRRLAALVVAAAGIGAASFALSVWWTATVQPQAYLATPTRVWQFMAGGLLAVCAPLVVRAADGIWARSARLLTAARWLVGSAGLLALLWSIHALDAEAAYPGLLALVPTLGTVAVILAGSLVGPGGFDTPDGSDGGGEPPSGVSWLLGRGPFRAIGRVSYSWYLWHWPVVVLVPYALGDARQPAELGWPALCALSFAAIVPAWASMRLVEDPVRFARAFSSVPRGLAVGAAAVVVPLVAAVAVGVFTWSLVDRSLPMTDRQVSSVMSAPLGEPGPDASQQGAVMPAPAIAQTDVPEWQDCFVTPLVTRSPGCHFGAPSAPRRIVLFGDSHAAQLLSPLDAIGRRAGYRVDLRAKASCNAADYDVDSVPLGRLYTECRTWRNNVLDELAADPPEVVVLATYNSADRQTWEQGWDRSLRRILATGTRILYLRPTPIPDFDVPTCLSGALDDWSRCSVPIENRAPDPVAEAIAAGKYPGAGVVDLSPYLCADGLCPVVRDHVMVYRDRSHLTDTAARGLEPVLRTALKPYLRDRAGR